VHTWTRAESSLKFNGDSIEVAAMTYSPSVDVTAELAVLSNRGCSAADYPSDLKGKIALIKRGECAFAEKSVLAAGANAAAVLVYNNVPGSLSGTLGGVTPDHGSYVAIGDETSKHSIKLRSLLLHVFLPNSFFIT
jgi:carboxypeptidase Q